MNKTNSIRGILFDLDGVLVENELDFELISREIFGEVRSPLLESISRIKNQFERRRAHSILEKHERRAANSCILKEGVSELLKSLDEWDMQKGVVTRNSKFTARTIIRRFGLAFDVVVSREDAAPKPAKDPVVLACRQMGLSPDKVVFLGDYEFDMIAGKKAGAFTVLLRNSSRSFSPHADRMVNSIWDFIRYMRNITGKT